MPLPVLNGPLVSVYEAQLALSLKDYGPPLHLAYSPAKRGACLPAGAVVWHFWVEQLLDHNSICGPSTASACSIFTCLKHFIKHRKNGVHKTQEHNASCLSWQQCSNNKRCNGQVRAEKAHYRDTMLKYIALHNTSTMLQVKSGICTKQWLWC